MSKVLIVDDDYSLQQYWAKELEGKAEILAAYTLLQARSLLAKHRDTIAAIVSGLIDGKTALPELEADILRSESRARIILITWSISPSQQLQVGRSQTSAYKLAQVLQTVLNN